MTSRRASVLAWGLCALTLAAAALALVLSVSDAGTDWGTILPAGAAPASEEPLLSAFDVRALVFTGAAGGTSRATRSAGCCPASPPR